MQFRQIEAFVNVVRYKSFTEAAEMLNLSQPAISTQIAELEKELGEKLLTRSTRDVDLTPAGEAFYRDALKILEIRDNAVAEIRDFYNKDKVKGTLRIVASTAPIRHLLPKWLAKMCRRHPALTYEILPADSFSALQYLTDKEAELAVVGSQFRRQGFDFHEVFTDRLVFIAPKEAPWLSPEGTLGADPDRPVPFIRREDGSGTRREAKQFLSQLPDSKKNFRIVAEFPSNEAVVEAVAQGVGCAIVAGVAAADDLAKGRIQELADYHIERTREFYLVHRSKAELSPGALAFREMVFEELES